MTETTQEGLPARQAPRFVSVPELAELVHVAPSTLYRAAQRGELPGAIRVTKGRLVVSLDVFLNWTEKKGSAAA